MTFCFRCMTKTLQRKVIQNTLLNTSKRFVSRSILSDSGNYTDEDIIKKKKGVRKKDSGSASETEELQARLTELTSGSEWEPWDEDLKADGELTDSIPLRSRKKKSLINRDLQFADTARIICTGGIGGDGCIAFLRLYANPFGGPSGGDGGNGGHVILESRENVKSLQELQVLYKAENGEHGKGKHMIGKSGEHTVIPVPIGTIVKEELTGRIVAELDCDGSKFIAARGGAGGKGNLNFLSNQNRHPNLAEVGAKGEKIAWIIELKISAHAGFVGFPNAGKSTLLQAISRAKPTVASTPFTTLRPYIGIIQYDDYEQLAVADLPGLIPGAHQNRGLGITFLRHIEKCLCLFFVIDLSVEKPWEQLECLKYELEQYRPGLSRKPQAIIANKIDLPQSEANLKEMCDFYADLDIKIIPISGKTGKNTSELLRYLREMYDLYTNNKRSEQAFMKW